MAIPQLSNYVRNAFNTKDGNFLSKPIFKETTNNQETVRWDGRDEVIPDQISASAASYHDEVKSTLLMASKSDYDRQFSMSLGAEYSGVTFSGSVNSNYLYHGNLFTQKNSSYGLNFFMQRVLEFERKPVEASDLEDSFVAAIQKLPTDLDTGNAIEQYFDFFDAYGTHYLKSGTMGGQIVMETRVDNSLIKSSTQHEVSAAISAGYSGVVANGSLNASAAYSSNDFLEQNRDKTDISLHVMGGIYTSDSESITEWARSIYETPSLLLSCPTSPTRQYSVLVCITDLVAIAGAAERVADNIRVAIQEYIVSDAYDDGLLGLPTEIHARHVYHQQLGAAIVLGMVSRKGNEQGARSILTAYNTEQQQCDIPRAMASQIFWTQGDVQVPVTSLALPVPLRSYYDIADNHTSSVIADTKLSVVEFGDDALDVLGPWTEVPIDTLFKPEQDGFVVAYVDWNGVEGTRAAIEGIVGDDKQVIAGASQHRYGASSEFIPCNSFCMPVKEGQSIDIKLKKTSGSPVAKAFYIPLSKTVACLGEMKPRKRNTTYEAQEDGFLLAYLDASHDGDRGVVHLKHGETEGELETTVATSVHFYKASDTWVPQNSALLPVVKGRLYRAQFESTAGNTDCYLHWFPLHKAAQ